MNEEPTKHLPNGGSFEERVFARFDAVEARFDTVDARLEKLEVRSYDTKPIWERALAQIVEIGLEIGEIKTKAGVIENKVTVIETDVAVLKTDYAGIKNELVDMKRELKHHVNKRLDLILEFLLEDREDIRDAHKRIKQLETKLA